MYIGLRRRAKIVYSAADCGAAIRCHSVRGGDTQAAVLHLWQPHRRLLPPPPASESHFRIITCRVVGCTMDKRQPRERASQSGRSNKKKMKFIMVLLRQRTHWQRTAWFRCRRQLGARSNAMIPIDEKSENNTKLKKEKWEKAKLK